MTSTRRPILLLAALGGALAGLIGLVGCGTTATAGPVGTPQAIIASAPDITLGAGTAKVIISSPHAGATGVIDLPAHRGLLTVTASYASPATVVIVGGSGYIRIAPGAAYRTMPGPLPLASITDDNPKVIADGSDVVLPNADPWADIDLLRGTVHILSDGGGEVDGASTIAYTLTINPQQAIAMAPAGDRPALQAMLAGRTKPFTIEVAIDSQFRIRQIEVGANLTAPDFKGETPPTRIDGATIGSDVDFVSFGVPMAPVTVPPNLKP